MRLRPFGLILGSLALLACQGAGPGGGDDDTGDDDGSGAADAGSPPVSGEVAFVLESFDVPAGSERQVCKVVNIPAGAALDIVVMESTMAGTSHHFNAYKVLDGTQFTPAAGAEAQVHDCEPASGQLDGSAAYIYGSSSPEKSLSLPAGVAFHLEGGQRLMLEQHVINTGDAAIQGGVTFTLVEAQGAPIAHHADIGWYGNWTFYLQAGERSFTTSCATPYAIEVFGLASHTHALGKKFTISRVSGGQRDKLYESTDWAHPKYQTYEPTESFAAGDALEWTCTWNNTTGGTVFPGKDSTDEMCIAFAYYYPRDTLDGAPLNCNNIPF
jgi:hypothetical protein